MLLVKGGQDNRNIRKLGLELQDQAHVVNRKMYQHQGKRRAISEVLLVDNLKARLHNSRVHRQDMSNLLLKRNQPNLEELEHQDPINRMFQRHQQLLHHLHQLNHLRNHSKVKDRGFLTLLNDGRPYHRIGKV